MTDTFLIVGAGLAGAKAAETLRSEGFDGRVMLVGDEPERPYERPPLSKRYLKGDAPREDVHVHPAGFYDEHGIELLSGTLATALDADRHEVTLADGRRVRYERLLIATGSVPRRPPIEGIERDGVHVLRTVADADALRARIGRESRVAVIGAGWIGCEVAAAARELGAHVTLIEQRDAPLEAVLGRELGSMYADIHRAHGVRVITGARVARIQGDERAEGVRLQDGTVAPADVVVVGVGATPDTRFAASGGLEIGDGIVADELLRTSAADVFVAGDVANAFHPGYGRHLRVEHRAHALHQGVAASRSMLDRGEPYRRLPYFSSDQYTVGMEYAGHHESSDRLVLRGSLGGRKLHAFWLGPDGRVTAGMHVNEWHGIEPIKALIASEAPIDAARLSDQRVPLPVSTAAAVAATLSGA